MFKPFQSSRFHIQIVILCAFLFCSFPPHIDGQKIQCNIANKQAENDEPLTCYAFRTKPSVPDDVLDCCWTATSISPSNPPLTSEIVSVHQDGSM